MYIFGQNLGTSKQFNFLSEMERYNFESFLSFGSLPEVRKSFNFWTSFLESLAPSTGLCGGVTWFGSRFDLAIFD